jgi:hypothetical protein
MRERNASLEVQRVKPVVCYHLSRARLGFETQNAAAFRFLRLVGNASRTEADEIISDTIAPPRDSTTAAIKVAPKGRRSISKSKVYKKTSARKQAAQKTLSAFLRLSTPLALYRERPSDGGLSLPIARNGQGRYPPNLGLYGFTA